jgi:hypothetical protein
MSVLFSNNASTTLSAGVGNSATSITVADGSVFPAISGGDYFYVTLEVDSDPDLKEIVKCTARSGNTLTIVRAQDGTSARTFSTADKCELRLTAAGLNDVATQADTDTTYSIGDGGLTQNNFTDALKTKLDGTEASADVTDTTNVTAAGALMDSEVTNLAQVKAFDSADYATAAQGTTADAALPKAGGALTGAVTTTSTFDGRDVATDGTKLDGIEAGADVTDTTNVTAAGALMDSEVTNLAQVKAFDSSDYATAAQADQTVALTGAGTTSISGTYPNFTITSTGGSGGNETLAQTLALGNTTGGTDLEVSTGDSITLPDAAKIKLGDEPNLEIYHSGSHSFIEDVAGGSLFIKGGPQLKLMNDNENAVLCQKDGAVTLYHNNSAKVATTSTGVSVTGNIELSGTADGRDLATDGTKLDGIEAGATADQTAAQILTAIKTVDGSGSGLDADTVDGVQAIQLYRRTGSAAGTAGAGWVTVASNVSGRHHGEVIVSDSDSGDHSFIRIDWLRSYADSEFTVINSGGHANRITAVRVLEQTSDLTYGTKYLQVLTTTSSTYSVRVNTVADVGGYSSHTAVTPVTQNVITGYQTGAATELLDSNNLASSQGIASGNGVFQSTAEDAELKYYYNGSSFSGLKCSVTGAHTTAASGKLRFGSSSASFVQNGPGVSSNLTIAANGGSSFFYGSTGAVSHHATIATQSRFNCGYGSVQDAYMVRAWGRFEMTGTHSFRDDEGFSSITDIATGRSRLNFTNTMPNSYYSVQITAGTSGYTSQVAAANIYSASTSQFYISVEDVDSNFIDKDQMNVTVVR